MAVLHELPESIVTDLPLRSVQLLGRDAKRRAERDAWAHLLPQGELLDGWRALWDEYEAGQTLEAKLARVADKFEMVLQAYEYQRAGYRNLDDFWGDEVSQDADLEPVGALWAELARRRAELD
jgi:putative hydrolase of HD superfamily